MNRSRHGAIIFFGLILSLTVRAGFAPVDQSSARSSSGQFLVSGGGPSPLFRRFPDLKDDPNLVRLDPALLAVSAERARDFFWRQLGWPGGAPWRGKIYFRLRPAVTLDDPVTISARAFGGVWDFSVDLPDLLTRARFARTLAGVILVERANEQSLADGGTAPVPSWLADGLAQQLLAGDNADIHAVKQPARVRVRISQACQSTCTAAAATPSHSHALAHSGSTSQQKLIRCAT